MSPLLRSVATLAVSLVTVWGCSSEEAATPTNCAEESGEPQGSPSGATCPADSTLAYDTFAKPFAEKYCTRCHSSSLTGAARQCAPLDHDCDSEAGLLEIGEHIDEAAAAGPDAINTAMPPSGPMPTEAERRQLGEWLACNADAWGSE